MATDVDGNEIGKLFVGGLPQCTNKTSLHNYFSNFGEVDDAVVMMDHRTGRSRGFGYVKFKDVNSVALVMQSKPHILDSKEIDAKQCNVHMRGKNRRSSKIFVGGISPEHDADTIRKCFEQYGTVTDVNLMLDHTKQKHRGFAFVGFQDESVVKLLIAMHYVTIGGKQVEIKEMEPPHFQEHSKSSDTRSSPSPSSKSYKNALSQGFGESLIGSNGQFPAHWRPMMAMSPPNSWGMMYPTTTWGPNQGSQSGPSWPQWGSAIPGPYMGMVPPPPPGYCECPSIPWIAGPPGGAWVATPDGGFSPAWYTPSPQNGVTTVVNGTAGSVFQPPSSSCWPSGSSPVNTNDMSNSVGGATPASTCSMLPARSGPFTSNSTGLPGGGVSPSFCWDTSQNVGFGGPWLPSSGLSSVGTNHQMQTPSNVGASSDLHLSNSSSSQAQPGSSNGESSNENGSGGGDVSKTNTGTVSRFPSSYHHQQHAMVVNMSRMASNGSGNADQNLGISPAEDSSSSNCSGSTQVSGSCSSGSGWLYGVGMKEMLYVPHHQHLLGGTGGVLEESNGSTGVVHQQPDGDYSRPTSSLTSAFYQQHPSSLLSNSATPSLFVRR